MRHDHRPQADGDADERHQEQRDRAQERQRLAAAAERMPAQRLRHQSGDHRP
jgi:hypothetical protein